MSVCVTCVAIQMQSRYVLTELPLFPILVAIRYVHLGNALIVLKDVVFTDETRAVNKY